MSTPLMPTMPEQREQTMTDEQILNIAADFRSTYNHAGTSFDDFDELGFARALIAALPTPAPTMVDGRKAAEVEVREWMGENDVVLKTRAYKALVDLFIFARNDVRFATRPTLQSLGGDAGVSEAMVDAYLQANDAYWKRTDQLPTPPDKWRTGTPREATRESLRAALSLTSTDSSDGEIPSAKQQKLYELADRIDHERLCLRPGMTHRDMTPEQRDRMNAGVELRRYARIWKADRWIIVPPVGPVQFSASTLDKAYEMAKKDEGRNALPAAPKAAEKSGRSE